MELRPQLFWEILLVIQMCNDWVRYLLVKYFLQYSVVSLHFSLASLNGITIVVPNPALCYVILTTRYFEKHIEI